MCGCNKGNEYVPGQSTECRPQCSPLPLPLAQWPSVATAFNFSRQKLHRHTTYDMHFFVNFFGVTNAYCSRTTYINVCPTGVTWKRDTSNNFKARLTVIWTQLCTITIAITRQTLQTSPWCNHNWPACGYCAYKNPSCLICMSFHCSHKASELRTYPYIVEIKIPKTCSAQLCCL